MAVDYRINYGQNLNYFEKLEVSNATFGNPNDGYRQDVLIPFTTRSFMFLIEETAGVVEYSFNGIDIHGELDSTSTYTKLLTFHDRVACKIWFRVKSGSSPGLTVRIDAWA